MWDFSNDEVSSSLVPDGVYSVQVEKVEMKQTKDNAGEYLSIQFNILGPSQAGRKLFAQYNMKNKNEKAVQIGRGQLRQMLEAAGVDITRATPEAMLMAELDVKIGNKTDDHGEKNVIKKYMPSSSNAVPSSDAVTF